LIIIVVFILGKGKAEAIAKEASLKIKEISYTHAEGYSSSALKHGPFALLERGVPVIIIANDNEHYDLVENAYEEIKARHATIVFVTDKNQDDHSSKENLVVIPRSKTFGDLLAVVPMQLLAYKLSVARGYNPDMPKNLAKSVTVL
jgi:glutamine---fructose-6-phosphate transaminase (isomerizing)